MTTPLQPPQYEAPAADAGQLAAKPVWATPVYPPQPPLSIGHLMLWMLGAGVILALYRQASSLYESNGWLDDYRAVFSLFGGILGGIGVASLMLAVIRRLQGGAAFPCQPGHWLLMIFGTGALLNYLVLALQSAAFTEPGRRIFIAHLLVCLVTMILSGIVCFRLQDAPRWRFFLAALAAYFGLRGLAYAALASGSGPFWFSNACFRIGTPVLLITAIAVGVLDLRRSPQRDWLHWVGVVTQILSLLVSTLSSIALQILLRLYPL